MVSVRVLGAMTMGAVVATIGALSLGEYEFDETLPIVAGPLLGYIIAEVVVSVGRHRSWTMSLVLALIAGTSVVLAGHIDANDVEPIKVGAYADAALAAAVAAARAAPPRRARSASGPGPLSG